MSRALAELLAPPPRARMLPDLVLARAAALADVTTSPASAPDPQAAVERVRAGIGWCLGLDRIPRAAPAWQALGELPGDGYTIERGVYTAVPGLPVPAHVYRPAAPGPHPAVVHTPGHWMENARLAPDLQRFNAGLARAGMVVLCPDPLGQGERRRGWHQHGQLAPLLVGFTSLGVMVVEAIAALDVLAARDDVDPARLALAGASGGGFVSTFAAVVDPRVRAACICCILNTHVGQLRDAAYGTGWDGWVDLCNQVPRLAATATMGVVVGAAAPRDVIVVHAVDDPPFPIRGARTVVREARDVYAALRVRDRVRLHEVSGGHGLHAATRTTATAALAEALDLPPPPPEAPLRPLEEAWPVTHEVARAERPQAFGRPAARLPGESLPEDVDSNEPLVRIARDLAARLREGRKPTIGDVAATLGPATPERPFRTPIVANHLALPDGQVAQRIELDVSAHVTLDAVLLLPDRWGDDLPGVLVVVDEGGKAVALDGPAAAVARERGWAVLALDLRGTGESAASEFELATASWLLDRDLLAERVGDLRTAVGWLSERYSTGQQLDKGRIAVHGAGAFGLVASLAAALDARIAGGSSGPFATTLEELLVISPRITPMAFPFRALETWDLPDLVRLAAPRPLHLGGAEADEAALVAGLLHELEG